MIGYVMGRQAGSATIGPRSAPSLIGRAELTSHIQDVLASGQHRLVTLVGPGGIGKTSLALVVAAHVEATGNRLAAFVELASVVDEHLVMPAIAVALGIEASGADGLLGGVANALGSAAPLLILDNLEQLPRVSVVIQSLLDAAPTLTVLATSRRRLEAPGELVIEIGPLATPGNGDAPGNDAGWRAYSAIALFENRVHRVLPEFSVTSQNGPEVAEIVRRLDGLPLAIELVTSRSRALSLSDMSARLNELLPLPATGSALPDRQQTILSSIAWSVELLPESAQQALERLSVFPGRFDLSAAGAVANATIGVIDLLIDHHLIRVAEPDEPSHRFDMPESVRQFGRHRLRDRGEEDNVLDRHAAWRHALTDDIEHEYFSPNAEEAVRRHMATIDDCYQALAWSLKRGDDARALELFINLNPHWSGLPWETVEHWWRRVEPLVEQTDLDPTLAAKTLVEAGRVGYGAGLLRESDERFIRATRFARISGDDIVLTLALRGHCATLRGLTETDRAAGLLDELRTLSGRVDNPIARYALFIELGAGEMMIQGDLAAAREDFQRALDVARAAGAESQAGNALHFLGYVDTRRGELETARDAFHRSIQALGKGPETQRLASLHGLGRAELMAGRFADAYSALSQSLAGRTRRGETLQVRIILTDLALLARAIGRPRLAAEWLGAIDLDESFLSPRRFFADRWNEAIDQTRLELGDEEYERALQRGRLEGLNEAVSAALAFAAPSGLEIDADQAAIARISPRELDVLRLLVEGASDRQIAETLFISPLTATRHVKNILRKLEVSTRTAAATLSVRRGIIRPDQ